MLKRTAATLSVLAGASASAAFARTGPGAVLHAVTTGAATVGAFVACYSLAAFPAEVRAARRSARAARLAARPPIDADVVLEPAVMTTEQVHEHWQAP